MLATKGMDRFALCSDEVGRGANHIVIKLRKTMAQTILVLSQKKRVDLNMTLSSL